MSFLNKIKGWGQGGASAESTQAADPHGSFDDAFGQHADARARDLHGTMPLEAPTVQQSTALDSSIIAEAAPSEMADFSETRIQGAEAANDMGSGLPLIGRRPVVQQQRILVGAVLAGLL